MSLTNPSRHRITQSIAAARRRHRAMMAGGGLAIAAILLVSVVFTAWFRGVAVEVRPDEAAIAAEIAISKGAAIAAGGTIYALGSDIAITVTAPGFRTATRRLPPDIRGRTVTVEMQPLPGQVHATTDPVLPLTGWTIDGVAAGVGPDLELELEAGPYLLGADHPFFVPAAGTVLVERGQMARITLALTPVAGRLVIASEPEGAAVLIGEEPVGTTPLTLTRPGGAYALSLMLDGYAPSRETVEITNDAPELVRRYRLQPLSGALTISASPAGGALLVNGAKVEPGTRLDLPAGDHAVSYTRAGYHGTEDTVRLAAGEDKKLTITLKPALGEVAIKAQPEADIFIDGVAQGRTPALLTLPARPTNLRLTRPGYRNLAETIHPKSGTRISIDRTLATERDASFAEAPKFYQNSLGMDFKLFGPASYTMGAPRHQAGQRANEFERAVKLTRHFYAGLHEVTNAQYEAFGTARTSRGGPDHPAVNITWSDAARFCNWLSQQEGLRPFYIFSAANSAATSAATSDHNANGYRLLSEAEWEYLARRAGRKRAVIFPWGDKATIPKNAGNIADETVKGAGGSYVPNYNDSYADSAPVGSFEAEASGLYDLTGNVSEWVHDRYDLNPPAAGAVFVDPLGSANPGAARLFKGSSFRSGDRTVLRASYREGFVAARDDIGFRLGRYLHGEK